MQLPYKFGKYALVEKIAQGGMAEIYRAQYFGEGGFVKEVAIKRILPHWSDNKDFIAMLCDEAKALVHLQHQNIVQVHELGRDGNTFYISMEYIEGVDLRRLFKEISKGEGEERGNNAFPIKFTCFIIAEILKGLDFAHSRTDKNGQRLGIIHRDISPQNILLSFNGEVKVADFGIAKGAHRSFETVSSAIKGKYAYMSPEQVCGFSIDARADIYAVGVILYELLAKRRLHNAPNDLMTIDEVKKSALPQGWEDFIPAEIRQIVQRALGKNPAERYQSAKEFLSDINNFVVANGLVTHGIELSDYLKEMFTEKDAELEDHSLANIKHDTIISVRKRQGVAYRRFGVALSAIFLAIANIAGHGLEIKTAEAIINNDVEAKIIKKEAAKKQIDSDSLMSIQARPWGYVYIKDLIERQETPLHDIKIKPGNYLVRVYYEPEDKWAQESVTIGKDNNVNCIADFFEGASLSCKSN